MTVRSWIGCGLAMMVLVIFALYIHQGHELNAVAGLIFGGGLLFCGILIDAADFKDVLNTVRGKPASQYPPLPGGPEGKFPTGEGK